VIEGARCAAHPDALAGAACERCGDFACGACLASTALCPRCRPLAGGRWDAGRKLSTLGILWHALGIFPRCFMAVIALAVAVVPFDVGAHLISSWRDLPGASKAPLWEGIALSVMGGLAGFVLIPIVLAGVPARACDLILGRPEPRTVLRAGRGRWGRVFAILAIEAVVTTVIACPFALVQFFCEVGETWQYVLSLLSVIVPVPVVVVFSLAATAAVIDDVPALRALARAWRFARTRWREVLGLLAIQAALEGAVLGIAAVREAIVERAPAVGLPLACGEAAFESASLVLWAIVFAAFWLARSRPDES
jgi:hypothetical protein